MKTGGKRSEGGALILILTMMLAIFLLAAVSLNLSNYEMLATNAYALNVSGYHLAEGGAHDAAKLLNQIHEANFYKVSEEAFNELKSIDLESYFLSGGSADLLYTDIYKRRAEDEAVNVIMGIAGGGGALSYSYLFCLNDIHETEYEVNIEIRYNNGGFDVYSSALNIKTRVSDAVIGRVEFTYDADLTETLTTLPGVPELIIETLTVRGAGSYGYKLISIKKEFV